MPKWVLRTARKAATIKTGTFTKDGEPLKAYFRSNVYEHPYFRGAVKNRILPLAHRLGKEYPAPGENSSWRPLNPEPEQPEGLWKLHDPELTLTQFQAMVDAGRTMSGQPQHVTDADTLDTLDAATDGKGVTL